MAFQSTMGQLLSVQVKEYPVQAEVGMGDLETVEAHYELYQKPLAIGQMEDRQSSNKF